MMNLCTIAQCADSEVRNAIERTPYIVVLKFKVIENDSVSDKKEHIFVGPLELKILSSLKQMILTKYNWMPLLFGTH